MAPSDAELARLAGPLRILRLEQLIAAGLSRKARRHRVEQGRLQLVWPMVYLVGPDAAGPHSLAYGATASYTGDAYVDQRWSCFVHGFHGVPDLPVDVLVAKGSRLERDGIRPHRCETLAPQDIGHIGQIPVTSAARAILGVAETASRTEVEA